VFELAIQPKICYTYYSGLGSTFSIQQISKIDLVGGQHLPRRYFIEGNNKKMNDRYSKYDFRNIRERPTDELEEQLADEEADQEAAKFLEKYGSSRNFRRRVLTKLAKRELDADGKEPADNGLG
jgi:hypothetical protein